MLKMLVCMYNECPEQLARISHEIFDYKLNGLISYRKNDFFK